MLQINAGATSFEETPAALNLILAEGLSRFAKAVKTA